MTELALTWAATANYRRLATVAMLPLLAAVVLGRPGYVVLAAPTVVALALAARRPGYGARVGVQVSGDRCVEGEEIIIRVRAEPGGQAGSIGARLVLPPALRAIGPTASAQGGASVIEVEWQVRAERPRPRPGGRVGSRPADGGGSPGNLSRCPVARCGGHRRHWGCPPRGCWVTDCSLNGWPVRNPGKGHDLVVCCRCDGVDLFCD